MTAIRHFPNAPLRQRSALPWRWQTPRWLISTWRVLERYGYRRAAFELEMQASHRVGGDPQVARQLAAAAAECRRASLPPSSRSPS